MSTVAAGQGILVQATFTTADGSTPTDVTLDVTDPNGAATTYLLGDLDSPAAGTYTRLLVPATPGVWTYVFHAVAGVIAAAPGSFNVAPVDWTPSVDDIGTLLRSRTTDQNGAELGTFTANTRPTANAVTSIIKQEAGAMRGFIGWNIDPSLWELAHEATMYRVAARIELDYFPEQVQSGRSSYEQLVADRDREEGRLISAVRATSAAGEAGGGAVGSLLTRPRAAILSETPPLLTDDIPPFSPGYPVGGAAGTSV